VGIAKAAVVLAKVKDGAIGHRSSAHSERHPVGNPYRCIMVGFAWALSAVADGLQPLSTLAQGGHLGPDLRRGASGGRCGGQSRLCLQNPA